MNLDGDVQKKMIPWSAMLPQLEERDSGEEVTQQQRPGAGELILVTSLIDKIPNLGGKCSKNKKTFIAPKYSETLVQRCFKIKG